MRRVVLMLAAAATAAIAASPAQSQRRPYEAHGFEPTWHLTVSRGRIVFDGGEGSRVSIMAPAREPFANGYRYVTSRITVRVERRECEDDSARVYADTVTVYANGRRFLGCGGAVVREPAD